MSLLDQLAANPVQLDTSKLPKARTVSPDEAMSIILSDDRSEVVPLEIPGKDIIQIRVVPLSYKQTQNIRITARKTVINIGLTDEESATFKKEVDNETVIETIFWAFKHPTSYTTVNEKKIYDTAFSSQDVVRNLTPAMIDRLIHLYEVVRQRNDISPQLTSIKNNLDLYINAIASAGEMGEHYLSFLSHTDLVFLSMSLCQIVNLLIDSPLSQSVNSSESIPQILNGDISSSLEESIDGPKTTADFQKEAREEIGQTITLEDAQALLKKIKR